MGKAIKIWWYKRKLKQWYLNLRDAEDEAHGGIQMKEMVSSAVRNCKERTNYYIRKLQLIDPENAPSELK